MVKMPHGVDISFFFTVSLRIGLVQAIRLSAQQDGSAECHCLVQVVRGGDNCMVTSEEDVHSVLRQYRAQQGSKPPLEGPCVEGKWAPAELLGTG